MRHHSRDDTSAGEKELLKVSEIAGSVMLIVVSLISGYLAQAAFTPSWVLSAGLLVCGLVCFFENRPRTAVALLAINGLALWSVWRLYSGS